MTDWQVTFFDDDDLVVTSMIVTARDHLAAARAAGQLEMCVETVLRRQLCRLTVSDKVRLPLPRPTSPFGLTDDQAGQVASQWLAFRRRQGGQR